MCGRIVLNSPPGEIAVEFSLTALPELAPRYNIPPGGPVAAIMAGQGERDRVLRLLTWGLVSPDVRWRDTAPRLINARAETIARKAAFAESFARRRCLIPVNGFYEWKKTGGRAQPFLIHRRDGGLFALAGIWNRWEYPGGRILEACAIITTEAADFMREIHRRMPVLIAAAQRELWLHGSADDADAQVRSMVPEETGALTAHAVDPRVGDPAFDEPRCLEPWRPGHAGQLALFGPQDEDESHD